MRNVALGTCILAALTLFACSDDDGGAKDASVDTVVDGSAADQAADQAADMTPDVAVDSAPDTTPPKSCAFVCLDNDDCRNPFRPICDDGSCVQCNETADCSGVPEQGAAWNSCNTTHKLCTQCDTSADCPGEEGAPLSVCSTSLPILPPGVGMCKECSADAHCTKSNDGPGSSDSCNLVLGLCLKCTESTDCPTAAPICRDFGPALGGKICVQCTADTDCADAAFKGCGPSGQCVGCRSDGECCPPSHPDCGKTCDTQTGGCNCTDSIQCQMLPPADGGVDGGDVDGGADAGASAGAVCR